MAKRHLNTFDSSVCLVYSAIKTHQTLTSLSGFTFYIKSIWLNERKLIIVLCVRDLVCGWVVVIDCFVQLNFVLRFIDSCDPFAHKRVFHWHVHMINRSANYRIRPHSASSPTNWFRLRKAKNSFVFVCLLASPYIGVWRSHSTIPIDLQCVRPSWTSKPCLVIWQHRKIQR